MVGKNSFRGPGNPDCQIVVINLLYVFYAKMLRETETEEALGFFVIFLSLVVVQLGGGPARPPPPPRLRLSQTKNYKNWYSQLSCLTFSK